jgi:pSer/pThr/pTyr-binding forkhead associated (FHA) protein
VGARRVPLGPEPIVFGRDPTCDVSLAADTLVSRRHARVYTRRGQVFVDDLDARNGTFVNGRRTRHSALRPGDVLRIGSTEITYPG